MPDSIQINIGDSRKEFRRTFSEAAKRDAEAEVRSVVVDYKDRIRYEISRKGSRAPDVNPNLSKAGNELKCNVNDRSLYKRSHPVFHDDLVPPDVAYMPKRGVERPGVPVYNPLDKPSKAESMSRRWTLEYMEPDSYKTVDEMTHAKSTSMGVLPPRDTYLLEELMVYMDGKSNAGIIKKTQKKSPRISPRYVEALDDQRVPVFEIPPLKPAIHSELGSSAPIQFSKRPAPPAMPKTRIKKLPKIIEKRSLSLKAHTEASNKRKTTYTLTDDDVAKEAGEDVKEVVPKERSVDDIIASLKQIEKTGYQLSDADLKIQEVLNRVLSRTQTTLGIDIETEPFKVIEDDLSTVTSEKTTESAVTATEQAEEESKADDPVGVDDDINENSDDLVKPSDASGDSGTHEEDAVPLSDQLDYRQAWQDLMADGDVTNNDIINVEGRYKPIHVNPLSHPLGNSMVEYVERTGSKPVVSEKDQFSIHQFCGRPPAVEFPFHLQAISSALHAPDKYQSSAKFDTGTAAMLKYSRNSHSTEKSRLPSERHVVSDGIEMAAQRVMDCVHGNTLESLEEQTQFMDNECNDFKLEGERVTLQHPDAKMFWQLAPPKMDLPPGYIGSQLFPNFDGSYMAKPTAHVPSVVEEGRRQDIDSIMSDQRGASTLESMEQDRIITCLPDVEEEDAPVEETEADFEGRMRATRHRHYSRDDLEQLVLEYEEREKAAREQETSQETNKAAKSDEYNRDEVEESPAIPDRELYKQIKMSSMRRTKSVGNDIVLNDLYTNQRQGIMLDMDYRQFMDELEYQRLLIQSQMRLQTQPDVDESTESARRTQTVAFATIPSREASGLQLDGEHVKLTPRTTNKSVLVKKTTASTNAGMKRAAENQHVATHYSQSRMKKGVAHSLSKKALQRLAQPRLCLERSVSVPNLTRARTVKRLEVAVVKQANREFKRRPSLPMDSNFQSFIKLHRKNGEHIGDMREWVRDIWDDWFDEVIPPSPRRKDSSAESITDAAPVEEARPRFRVEAENVEDAIDVNDDNFMIVEQITEEVGRLTYLIEEGVNGLPYNLARRGALLRKLGNYRAAALDLDRAIELEPKLIDAYWHRHLILFMEEKFYEAIIDLNVILKYNKKHANAFRARAEIYKRLDNTTMSIINYNQRIKLNPNDSESYYNRGLMYSRQGEHLLAQDDYQTAASLNDRMTDARFNHGHYYFIKENWSSAVNDFTKVLNVDPNDVRAYVFRGRALGKMREWDQSVTDFSMAIHLDPNNHEAFYYRGCLLRTRHPLKALQDLSTSILLDEGSCNVMAYLHRAILYMAIGRLDEATADLELVLMLDKNIACAYVNLGTIYVTRLQDYKRAIKLYTDALAADPTYVRAYVCRAEARCKLQRYKEAVADYTRVIHLVPGKQQYYILRGQVLLDMGRVDLASFCIRQASGVQQTVSLSMPQQAQMLSFIGDHEKAVSTLSIETRTKPTADVFQKLGAAQMKASQYEDAILAFKRAIDILTPYDQRRESMPAKAAQIYFVMGKCFQETGLPKRALYCFTECIQIQSKHSLAFYERGITRIQLKFYKGAIRDFNRTLQLNCNFFEAYLARACYYCMLGRYSKGILNCNEALRIKPTCMRALVYRGAMKYHIGAYEFSIKDFDEAVKLDPRCYLSFFNRAICHHALKKYNKALDDYSTVLLLTSRNKQRVLVNRGLLYFEMGNYENSMVDFKESCSDDEGGINIAHSLGLCLHKQNRLEEAIETFTKVLQLEPTFLDALIARGNTYMDYRNEWGNEMATRDYGRVLDVDPTHLPAKVNLAYCLQVQGHFQRAWDQFTLTIDQDTNYRPALEGRSVVSLQMGNMFGALLDLDAAIRVGQTAELLTNRGVIHQYTGDKVNAMKDFQRALGIQQDYALAWFNAGNLYFHNRQFSQARDYYNNAILHDGTDENAWLNRGICRFTLKDPKGAVDDLDHAIDISPLFVGAYFNRGNIYLTMGEYPAAEADFTKAIDLHPSDHILYKKRADARGKQGKKEDAIEDYKKALGIHDMLAKIKQRRIAGDN